MPDLALSFHVPGTAAPQGSKGAKVVKGRAILFDTNSTKLNSWRKDVAKLARIAVVRHGNWMPLDGGVVVGLRFYFERPASVPKRVRPFMIVKPDIDKLTRALLDAMTEARVYADDAKVVELHVYKDYADDHPAGVFVTVEEARATT